MTTSTSLYELILNLLRDPQALEDFQDNPDAYLASCGDFSSDDVKDAFQYRLASALQLALWATPA